MTYHSHENLFSYLSLFFYLSVTLRFYFILYFALPTFIYFNPSPYLLLFQAAQLAHVLDSQLKVMLKEVEKEKALK